MKRCKINFFTTLDHNIWINKQNLLDVIEEFDNKYNDKEEFVKYLKEEIEKCERIDE